eukprot:gnl/Carplike_NY0171/5237_a7149_269.p1 GENE.gnl/Carplike_NY0171/5237_a7149_269~~gnl/Carplike_NY0171/5237_a7149_269.p1  ORF type:complete len:238 (-),score=7.82 gnl/Carplike_NY0171/5237_a7149_269:46-759(-)
MTTECPPGKFYYENLQICLICKAGTYSPGGDITECISCPPGSYSSVHASECTPCGKGTESAWNCIDGHRYGSMRTCRASDMCKSCPEGTYGDQTGMKYCIPCGKGQYNDYVAATSESKCTICPAGSFCPYEATSEPISCSTNSYSSFGSIECLPCESFWKHTTPNLSECNIAPSILIVPSILLLLIALTMFYIFGGKLQKIYCKREILDPYIPDIDIDISKTIRETSILNTDDQSLL